MSELTGKTTARADDTTRDPGRRYRVTVERVAAAIGAASLVVALLAWLFPNGDGTPSATPSTSVSLDGSRPTGGASAGTPTGTDHPEQGAFHYLADLQPQAGGGNLTGLPRDLRDTPGLDRVVMIECPSNQSNDKMREVTYQLLGRYDSFATTVRPHFTSRPDALMHVEAFVGERARDGSLVWTLGGGQYEATADEPAPLTAVVEGAAEMTIRVRCELPDGVAILVDAALYE